MDTLTSYIDNPGLRQIAEKIIAGNRISPEEGLLLYTAADLPLLGMLAGKVRRKLNGKKAFFNRNFHIEPTNKCVYNCRFCSYHRAENDPDSWEYTQDEMLDIVRRFDAMDVTEVHIVGGVHPSKDIYYYCELIRKIRHHRPE